MDKPSNPRAFPTNIPNAKAIERGMSLRDYFAGQALASLAGPVGVLKDKTFSADTIATICYNLADAMLEQREKSKD